MSFGLMRLRKLLWPLTLPPTSMGTPSSTMRGSFDALSDAPPRTRMVLDALGEPPELMICTPATLPLMSSSGDEITPPLKSFSLMVLMEPVRSFFFCTP